jgi:hypothetical protein
MKTTIKTKIQKHLLESILNYEEENFKDFESLKSFVQSEFKRVANYPYNLQKIPNNFLRFSDYLHGIQFNLLFYYSDVKDYLNIELGYKTKFSDSKCMLQYHSLIYTLIFNK